MEYTIDAGRRYKVKRQGIEAAIHAVRDYLRRGFKVIVIEDTSSPICSIVVREVPASSPWGRPELVPVWSWLGGWAYITPDFGPVASTFNEGLRREREIYGERAGIGGEV